MQSRLLALFLVAFSMLATTLVTVATADTAEAQQVGAVRLVITADKVGPGNDGWVELSDGSKQWVPPWCRSRLEGDGLSLVVLPWVEIDAMPDTTPEMTCSQVRRLDIVRTARQLVITADKVGPGNDGWVELSDGSKQWVPPWCRSRLEGDGLSLVVLPWVEIDAMPDASPEMTCNQLRSSLPAEDVTAPQATIVSPDALSSVGAPVMLTGTATDNVGVDRVRLAIVNLGSSQTWDGSSFTDAFTRVDATVSAVGGRNVTWTYEIVGAPASSVRFTVIASDAAGNVEETRPRRRFTITSDGGGDLDEAANLALLLGNATRNTQFDANPFRGVPMNQISIADLTTPGDLYNEGLLDTTNSGYFRVKCEVSHFAYDDPIVYPDQAGRAHLHMFFGNTEANAFSDFRSLKNTGTGTCNGADLNRTAYWVPAMLDDQGNALIPFEIMVYYKNDNFRLGGANELVSPFPNNLRMIAGNGAATSPQTTPTGGPGSLPVISFSCGPAYGSPDLEPLIPDCYGTGAGPYGPNGRALEMKIAFPQCFNPDAGTYRADQSHMSYSEGGYYGARCPDSHSTDVSSIMYRIFYSPDEYGGALTNLHLSSDVKPDQILPGGTTAHADWFGAWHAGAMNMWVQNCNNIQADCEIGLLRRSPALSLLPRQENFYPYGYRAPAAELIELCPGKELDPADQLRSVAVCRHG